MGRMGRLVLALLLAAAVALAGCGGGRQVRPERPPEAAPARLGDLVAATAKSQLGAHYLLGGHSPGQGFDCSGLAWWSHARHGVNIPRTAAEQFAGGRSLTQKELRPGDLVFFDTTKAKSGVEHVGVYLGGGRFIHAPKSGDKVRFNALGETYWRRNYRGARRYAE